MRRNTILTAVFVVVVGALLGTSRAQGHVQQATPPTGGSVGVRGALLGSGEPDKGPGQTLSLRRITFEPGGRVALHHHPGALVLYVESGMLGYTVQEGSVTVVRSAVAGTPGPTERLMPGVEAILNPGDRLFEQGVTHSARAVGDAPAVILVAGLTATDQPFTVYHEMATPAS